MTNSNTTSANTTLVLPSLRETLADVLKVVGSTTRTTVETISILHAKGMDKSSYLSAIRQDSLKSVCSGEGKSNAIQRAKLEAGIDTVLDFISSDYAKESANKFDSKFTKTRPVQKEVKEEESQEEVVNTTTQQ